MNARLRIPAGELRIRATRAGGPGGQHVNTSSTRVEVEWSVSGSQVLDPADRERLLTRLASRLDSRGTLRIVSSETRSQVQNRARALDRLGELVAAALVEPKRRKKTRPGRAAKEQRLDTKKRRSAVKRHRSWKVDD